MKSFFKGKLKAVENDKSHEHKQHRPAVKAAYIAYSVIDAKTMGKPAMWCRIGAAFHHKDGGGFDLVLNALPINGRLALRKPKTEADQAAIKSAALELDDDEGGAIVAFEVHHDH